MHQSNGLSQKVVQSAAIHLRKSGALNLSSLEELRTIFNKLDTRGTGGLEWKDLSNYLFQTTGRLPPDSMFKEIDSNQSGKVEFTEFVKLLEAVGVARIISDDKLKYKPPSLQDVKTKLGQLDKSLLGGLDRSTVNAYLKKLGKTVSEPTFKTMDKNGTGRLELTEFYALIQFLQIEKL
eukprot:TRINITY_DN48994_c0_g1_i1.p1 TRINITY_DN48994_c0_g1~~TRINITY_DN48994_c0_g1_i1.p1  ORF type:complete len:204 (+),score=23.71 TRINITY_DN48994_c0_g1_i1:77-613(+)